MKPLAVLSFFCHHLVFLLLEKKNIQVKYFEKIFANEKVINGRPRISFHLNRHKTLNAP